MNERVRSVAKRNRTLLLDTVQLLSLSAERGIVGFGEFCDYVHLTPQGVIRVAGEIFEMLQEMEIAPASAGFDPQRYVNERIGRLDEQYDSLAVFDWIGFSFEPSRIGKRDLWKYDLMVKELSDRLEEDPDDAHALVYRGNASYFKIDGAQDAERDYLAALSVAGDDPAIRMNLELVQNRLQR